MKINDTINIITIYNWLLLVKSSLCNSVISNGKL